MFNEWKVWVSETDLNIDEVMASDTEVVFQIDDVQFAVKAGDEEQDLPWRFEIVNYDDMNEERETWIEDVNEDF